MDLDLEQLVVWGTAARIFAPDLRQASRHILAAAVRSGVNQLRHQQNIPAAPAASPSSDHTAHESEA